MGLYSSLRDLGSLWVETKKTKLELQGKPNTKVDSGGTRGDYSFDGQEIDRGELRDIKNIRESGGVVATLVDGKALMQFGPGADFEAEEDDAAEWLHEQFNDLDNLLIDIGKDATWFPFALGEIVETAGGGFSHVELVEPWTMAPKKNDVGEIIAWEQEIQGTRETNVFEPDELASFVLNKKCGRDKIGISEVARAEDEITAFKENQKVVNDALEYLVPHNHWKVGAEGQAMIDDNELRRVRNMVQDMDGDTQFITGPDIEHSEISLPKFDVKEITENDIRQLCVALGVPIELASVISEGLGSGEQSSARQVFFDLEKRAKQRALGGQFVEQIARILLRDYSPYDPEQKLDCVFRDSKTLSEKKEIVDAIGEDLKVNERRRAFDYAELDDESKGESFDSPGEESSQDDPMGGIFGEAIDSALEERDLSKMRALQEDFDATLFELIATEEQEEFETGARLGIGVEFPNSGVYVDWNIDAWPEEERLDGPHVSDYATIDDAKKVAQGEVRELSANDLGSGTGNSNLAESDLAGIPEWDEHFLEIHKNVFAEDTGKQLFGQNADYEVPEFVKERLKDAIRGGAVFSSFENIPSSDLMQLREYLTESLEDGNWNIDGIADQIMQLDESVSRENAEVIARTETASVVNTAREEGYEERGNEDDLFYWTGVLDGRQTEACEWLINRTNPNQGGNPVPMDELKELIEEAPEHDPDMQDNLARPENFVVHPNERKTFVRYVE